MRTGRPTKYRRSFLDIAGKMWAAGANDTKVAKKLGITRSTLNEFCAKHAEFSDTRTESKAIADDNVEQSLYNRATGSVLPDCHVAVWEGRAIVTRLRKHYPPDVGAISLWLRNRRSKHWRDKTELALVDEVVGVPAEVVAGLRQRFIDTVSQEKGISKGFSESGVNNKVLCDTKQNGNSDGNGHSASA